MKRKTMYAVTTTVICGFFIVGIAFAQMNFLGKQNHGQHGMGGHGGRHVSQGPHHLIMKPLMDNMVMNALTEMTGKDAATIQTEIQDKRIPEILELYAIDASVFHATMNAKLKELVTKLMGCGLLTSEQATEITTALDNLPQPVTENNQTPTVTE